MQGKDKKNPVKNKEIRLTQPFGFKQQESTSAYLKTYWAFCNNLNCFSVSQDTNAARHLVAGSLQNGL
jgi:hypothetical protein